MIFIYKIKCNTLSSSNSERFMLKVIPQSNFNVLCLVAVTPV